VHGVAYDDATGRIFTMEHSRDPGSSVAIDAATAGDLPLLRHP
jgi:hypothetical protein